MGPPSLWICPAIFIFLTCRFFIPHFCFSLSWLFFLRVVCFPPFYNVDVRCWSDVGGMVKRPLRITEEELTRGSKGVSDSVFFSYFLSHMV